VLLIHVYLLPQPLMRLNTPQYLLAKITKHIGPCLAGPSFPFCAHAAQGVLRTSLANPHSWLFEPTCWSKKGARADRNKKRVQELIWFPSTCPTKETNQSLKKSCPPKATYTLTRPFSTYGFKCTYFYRSSRSTLVSSVWTQQMSMY